MRRLAVLTALGFSVSMFACGDARVEAKPPTREPVPPAPSASGSAALDYAYPPDGPVPMLRVGALVPKEYADIQGARVAARHMGVDGETLLVDLPLTDEQLEDVDSARERNIVVTIARAANDPRPHSFATRDDGTTASGIGAQTLHLWIHRPSASAGSLGGDVYTPATPKRSHPGAHFRFRVDDTRKTVSDPATGTRWMRALADHLSDPSWGWHRGPWNAFAANRLRELAPAALPHGAPMATAGRAMPPARPQKSDLARLMETTTGITSIQEALQHERRLFFAAAREKATVPLASLKGPPLAAHPWKTMSARLKTTAPDEALAHVAPAEFHFTRAADVVALLRVLDHVDSWGTPLARIMNQTSLDRDAASRYETELGLRRGPLTRALGPTAIADLAIVGSDPYLLEGSDLTVIFRAKSRALLEPALAGALAGAAEGHGALSSETRAHDGVDVTVSRTPDGAVHQQRAALGDFELVSNSAAAIDLVIDTAHGKHGKLSDEADFQFMLARDAATRGDVLSFMSDKFVAEVIGPRQKVLEARRQIALAELMTPGFAALLFGHLRGKSPTATLDLEQAKLLTASELSHAGGGGAITWKPGSAARSTWGTAAALTPLLDLPAPTKVTESERAAYVRFVESYQSNWSRYIDPVAVRVALDPSRITVDVRELPLIDLSDYKDVAEFVGDTRIEPGKASPGMRAVFAVGETSSVRQALSTGASLFTRRKDVGFDWVADWAMVGVLDQSQLALSAAKLLDDELPQPPKPEAQKASSARHEEMNELTRLPIYAAIGVRNPVGAALALAALRTVAEEMVPGMVEWGEGAKHRGVAVVRVSVNMKKEGGSFFPMPDDFRMHYALVSGALLIAFDENVVRHLIDDRLDGKAPRGLAEQSSGTQLAIDVGGEKGGALFTTMTWLLEMSLLEDGTRAGRATADALLRGAPERSSDPEKARALAVAYFGAVPAPPDGGAYTLAPEGLRDPARGTLYAPTWPALPIAGSPVAKVMSALSQLRTEIGFDDESGSQSANPMRSLHARATIDLR